MTGSPASRLVYTEQLHPLNVQQLVTGEFPPLSMLLAPILPEKAIAMVYGPRGIGKTFITLGIAVAVAAGTSFLRWQAPKPRSVLVIDGEMPAVTLQERLKQMPDVNALMNHSDRLRFIAADNEPDGLPDLGDPASQCYFDDVVREELWPEVGDGWNREGGISWGCLTPPLLHRRSDMPCPTIASSD